MEVDERTWRLVRKIAKNIRRIRMERGWTQEYMGELGFGSRWYQRFESGRHIPTIPTLDKLARVFKVDIVEFFK
jgi:transcriptional regulator with XRE-family HTH domain